MKSIRFRGKNIAFYECKDCKKIGDRTYTNRPNDKFCNPECKEYVDYIEKKKTPPIHWHTD